MAAEKSVLYEDYAGGTVAVQRTAFSLDALGRYICNTWDEAVLSGGIPFDAVVIGAGMYGGFCATKIYRSGGKVLLLDAGPFLVPEHVQNLGPVGLNVPEPVAPNSSAAQETRDLVWGIPWRGNQIFPGLAYCVGGKSLYWGGWSPRLTIEDLGQWPTAVRDYLNAQYRNVERQTGVAEVTDFIRGPLTEELRKRIDAAVPAVATLSKSQSAPVAVQGSPPAPSSGLFSFDKFSSVPLLMDAIREDIGRAGLDSSQRDFFLVPNVHVVRLETENGRVRQIKASVNGRIRCFQVPCTCQVILALSAIESTRLAIESFPTPLMGRNLMVHLRSDTTVRIRRAVFGGLAAGPLATAALHIPGKANNGGQFHLQLTAGANPAYNAEDVWFRMVPDIEEVDRILANQDAEWIAITLRGIGEMRGHRDRAAPDPAVSWIKLSPFEVDEFGKARAYVHLKTTLEDDAVWDDMDDAAIALVKKLANDDPNNIEHYYKKDGHFGWHHEEPPRGRLIQGLEDPRNGGVRQPLGTTYHESGTLWMGEQAADSVTDTNGQFHGVRNAYCADQALFPTVGSANPVLTGLVLARKVADAIVNRAAAPLEQRFTPILNFPGPTDLPDQWEQIGASGFVRRRDFVETNGGFGLLQYTAREYEDFELKVEWRCRVATRNNSGIFLRVSPKAADGIIDPAQQALAVMLSGYEVQIDDTGEIPEGQAFGDPYHMTGAIYEQAPASKLASRPAGQWNRFWITVNGARITVVLNDELITDFTDDPGALRSPKGYIALQNHFKGHRVQFRNLQIKAL